MKKILIFILMSSLFLTSNAFAAQLEVGSGQNYTTIQSAINAASNGDIINIHPATYTETLTISKNLTFVSEGTNADTIISYEGRVITIDNGASVSFNGITFSSNVDEGVVISSISLGNFNLENCRVINCNTGIDLTNFDAVVINGCTINSADTSLDLNNGNSVNIMNCNDEGPLTLDYASYININIVKDVEFTENEFKKLGIGFNNIVNGNIYNNYIEYGGLDVLLDNTANEVYLYSNVLVDCGIGLYMPNGNEGNSILKAYNNSVTISNDVYNTFGIGIKCTKAEIYSNIINGCSSGGQGIYIAYACSNLIYNNEINNFQYAFYIDDQTVNNKIYNNIINEDCGYLMFLENNNNDITGNLIYGNKFYEDGLDLEYSTGHENQIWNSSIQSTYTDMKGGLHNGIFGNYWTSYIGEDRNGDGIGETPYELFAGVFDYYPLVEGSKIPMKTETESKDAKGIIINPDNKDDDSDDSDNTDGFFDNINDIIDEIIDIIDEIIDTIIPDNNDSNENDNNKSDENNTFINDIILELMLELDLLELNDLNGDEDFVELTQISMNKHPINFLCIIIIILIPIGMLFYIKRK